MNGRNTIGLYAHMNRILKVNFSKKFINFEKQNPNELGYTILVEYHYGMLLIHKPEA